VSLNEQTFWELYDQGREDDAWDFKQEIGFSDKKGFAKFLKHLLGFSNFGGGYLLLGIRDGDHEIIGVQEEIDPANLGDKIEAALGFPIKCQLRYFTHRHDGYSFRLGILSIPPSSRVITSGKDLPGGNDDPIVRTDDVYYRRNTRTIKATTEDFEAMFKRITQNQAANAVVIENEASALDTISERHEAIHIGGVLLNRFEINAAELGWKLWESWKFKSRYSKLEFAQLMQIPVVKIDAYFEGKEIVDLNRIIVATKLFDLPPDYFFRPTYNMRFPFWQEDIVKYAILSLVQPKANIYQIDNRGTFYAHVINQLADRICDLHVLLFSNRHAENEMLHPGQSPLGIKVRIASEKTRSDIADKYYKLLEQYPRGDKDRSLVPAEHIIRHWFFATGEYIARIIIEGMSEIDIATPDNPVIRYRFEEDLERGEVDFQRYDSVNLKLVPR
jgi:hypothetical protein